VFECGAEPVGCSVLGALFRLQSPVLGGIISKPHRRGLHKVVVTRMFATSVTVRQFPRPARIVCTLAGTIIY
jgi:hypothetical protein